MVFGRDDDGAYKRRPTRGLDLARVMYPEGGGLEFAWKLRSRARGRGRAADRPAVHHRADAWRRRPHHRRGRHQQPHRRVQRHQGARHHRRHQRHHVPLRLRARHHRHRHAAGLSGGRGAAQRRVQLRAAGHAEVLFRGHHLRHPGGRDLGQRQGRVVHARLRAGLGRRGRRAAHRARHGDREHQGQHAALSRHVGDPRAPAGLLHPQQGEVDGQFLPQARRRGQDRHVRQDAVLRAQPDDQDGHPHRRRLPLRRAGAAGGGPGAGRLRQPFRRLPYRTVRRQRLDRRPLGDRGPRPAPPPALDAAEVNALHAETLAPLKPAAAAESDRILRELQAVMFSYDTGILKREDRLKQAFERVAALTEQFKEHCRAAHPRTGASEGDRGDAARGALHPRRLALPHRVAAQPFPRGSRQARRQQLAGLGGRERKRQRPGVHEDAGADAVLLGDAAAAKAVAACGASAVAGV